MSDIGRNDPCPCGSGKKYKKCCLGKPRQYSPELEADLELGKKLVEEYDNSLKKPFDIQYSIN